MNKGFQEKLDSVLYVAMCILSLGLYWGFRIVITKAIIFAHEQEKQRKEFVVKERHAK